LEVGRRNNGARIVGLSFFHRTKVKYCAIAQK